MPRRRWRREGNGRLRDCSAPTPDCLSSDPDCCGLAAGSQHTSLSRRRRRRRRRLRLSYARQGTSQGRDVRLARHYRRRSVTNLRRRILIVRRCRLETASEAEALPRRLGRVTDRLLLKPPSSVHLDVVFTVVSLLQVPPSVFILAADK